MNAAEHEKRSAKSGNQRQPTSFSVLSKTQPRDRNGRLWTELTIRSPTGLQKNGLPLYVVERSGFKKMMAVSIRRMKSQVATTFLGQAFQLFMLPPVKGLVKKY